jgi:hypothetical protein
VARAIDAVGQLQPLFPQQDTFEQYLVQVIIKPPHRVLDGNVNIPEGVLLGNLYDPPDWRVGHQKRYLELQENFRLGLNPGEFQMPHGSGADLLRIGKNVQPGIFKKKTRAVKELLWGRQCNYWCSKMLLRLCVFAALLLRDHNESGHHSRYPAPKGENAGKHDGAGFFVHDGCGRQNECQDQAANVHDDLQV